MKHPNVLAVLLFVVMTYACKKEKKSDPEPHIDDPVPSEVSSYSQFKVGNYWIYQQFEIDSLGVVTPTSTYDSCYIEKDTIIRGNTYFKIMKPWMPGQHLLVSFLRDSADCIVNSGGRVQLSISNFSSPLATDYRMSIPPDTAFKVVTQMADKDLVITVPAGTFTTINVKQTFYIYPQLGGGIKYQNNRFAKNVGLISDVAQQFVSQPTYYERRLVRYHLN